MGQAGNSEANSSRVGMSGKENSARVEDYLGRLRRALAGLTSEQAADIVEELRSHILEKVAGQGEGNSAAIEDVLAALGSPEALAAEYMADDLLARAARRRSPFLLLRALLRWASLSAAGVFVFIGCAIGYFLGASFMLCAFSEAAASTNCRTLETGRSVQLLFAAVGLWTRAPRRHGVARQVDAPIGIAARWGPVFSDHANCAVVCAAISQVRRSWSRITTLAGAGKGKP